MPQTQPKATLSLFLRRPATTQDLTVHQRWLLQIMCEYQFGRVENILVQGGQPHVDSGTRVVRVGGESGGTKVPVVPEFELKKAAYDLFDELALLGDGVIVRLEFKHGLPCILETTAAAVRGDLRSAPEAVNPGV
jgi:hypothetical protein